MDSWPQLQELRQAALFGIGLCAQNGGAGFGPYRAEAVQTLLHVMGQQDARGKMKESGTDNAAASLGKVACLLLHSRARACSLSHACALCLFLAFFLSLSLSLSLRTRSLSACLACASLARARTCACTLFFLSMRTHVCAFVRDSVCLRAYAHVCIPALAHTQSRSRSRSPYLHRWRCISQRRGVMKT